MKRHKGWATEALVVLTLGMLTGCGTAGHESPQGNTTTNTAASTETGNTVASNTVASRTTNDPTSNVTSTTTQTPGVSGYETGVLRDVKIGWYYTNLSTFGAQAQIVGVKSQEGKLQLTIKNAVTKNNQIRQTYKSAALQTDKWKTGPVAAGLNPHGYKGSWSLKFGPLNYKNPIKITLTHGGQSEYTLPSSVPGFASEIMTDPARFDNQVIGQDGSWVWIAMKGPQNAPFPQLTNGFRYWNRIVAVNTQTDTLHVYSIPRSTSSVSTASNSPAFVHVGDKVCIATGSWVGVLPAQPQNDSAPIMRSEPQATAIADQKNMLIQLQNEVTIGAGGLANYWNGYVINGNHQNDSTAWPMDPAYWNHGTLPENIDFAARFPLQKGSSADASRQKLFNQVEQLLKNPIDTAPIALDTREKIKTHFNSTPPAAIPGYRIQGQLYELGGTTSGNSNTSQSAQNVYVFSQPMLEEMYAVESYRSVGPIIAPANIQQEVDEWAPKVSMAMLPYAPKSEQALDKQLIQNIHSALQTPSKLTLLKSLPGYTLHHAQLPSGTRTYWFPSDNNFPNWIDPVLK